VREVRTEGVVVTVYLREGKVPGLIAGKVGSLGPTKPRNAHRVEWGGDKKGLRVNGGKLGLT